MPDNGLFSPLQIDTRSEEERLADLARQRAASLIQNAQSLSQGYRTPAARQSTQLGGMLGALLGQKFNPPTLTESQQKQADAVAAAQDKFMKYRSDNPEAPVEDLALQKQRYLAEELMKAGDFQNGMALGQQVQTITEQRQRAKAELARLEADTRQTDATTEATLFNTKTNKFVFERGKLTQIWPRGAKYGDTGFTAFIDEQTGAAKLPDGREIPMGEYSFVAPPKKLKDFSLSDLGITPTEAAAVRKKQTSVMSEMRATLALKDALKESISPDGSINIMGSAGKMSASYTQLIDNLAAVGRSVGTVLTVGDKQLKDLDRPGAAQGYVQRNVKALDDNLSTFVPEAIRNDKRKREQYYSILVQLAYSKGMANEPGTRALSDSDFQNSMAEIGATVSDPEAFRQIMLGNIDRDVQGFYDTMHSLPDGIDPDRIIGKLGADEFEKLYGQVKTEYGQDFGTATSPGVGLTGEQQKVLVYDPETGTLK